MGFRNIVSERIVSLQMEIDSLKNEVANLKKMVTMPQEKPTLQEEPKPWKPERGEEYFAVEDVADVVPYTYCEDSIDEYNIQLGNCFRTKERAEQVTKKMRLLLRLEQLHDMLCPDYVPDYEDDDEVKSHVYFDHSLDRYDISYSTRRENPCMVAFDTKKNALKAAEILNKELEESE